MNCLENPGPGSRGPGRPEPGAAHCPPPVNALSGSVWLGLALNTALRRLSAGVRRRREIRLLHTWYALDDAPPPRAGAARRPDRLG